MVSAFPYRTQVDHRQQLQTGVSLADAEQAEVLQVISSKTAQTLLCTLQAEPAPASDLAETVETSVQNVQYHLDRLCEVGLVESVDTWYSSRGRAMTVYAPTTERLVIDLGEPSALATESTAIN